MTDRKKALEALLEKVEAGDFPALHKDILAASVAHYSYGLDSAGYAWDAFNGSLDAAKSLHEAVLPGWEYTLDAGDGASVENRGDFGDVFSCDASRGHMALCWLIAILRALIEQEGGE